MRRCRPGDLIQFPVGLYLQQRRRGGNASAVAWVNEGTMAFVVHCDRDYSCDALVMVGLQLGWVASDYTQLISGSGRHGAR